MHTHELARFLLGMLSYLLVLNVYGLANRVPVVTNHRSLAGRFAVHEPMKVPGKAVATVSADAVHRFAQLLHHGVSLVRSKISFS
jgi:hypothetical protein